MAENTFHNALGGNSADQLRGLVHRIERLDEEIKALNGDKGELYKEANATGFCKKTLRKLVQRRRMDKAEVLESDSMLELYEAALTSGEQEERAKEKDPFD
jgi:uncharacterized protein (UPF0335 family)